MNYPYYSIFFFWSIGKMIYERQFYCSNIIEKYSSYFSYYYGNSSVFTRENLYYMKKFYLSFPIYQNCYSMISWRQYKLLLQIEDRKERYCYFYLSLFFKSDYQDTLEFIDNHYYKRLFN